MVLLQRDPRDVAISAFLQPFAYSQPWSTNLLDAAAYVAASQQLIRHWVDSLGTAIITVRYDNLVTEPHSTVKQLLAAVGLDASDDTVDACLDFWLQKQGRTATTASTRQVRPHLSTTTTTT